jgi:hypothetical protein
VGEDLRAAASAAAVQFANLAALRPAAPPLVALCALAKAPGSGEVALKVVARPGPLALCEWHTAAARLARAPGAASPAATGAEAALAARSLAAALAADQSLPPGGARRVALLTDRLHAAADFECLLSLAHSARGGLALDLIYLLPPAELDGPAARATLEGWARAEAAHPGLAVTAVAAGASAPARAAAALLRAASCTPAAAPLDLLFDAPLAGGGAPSRLELEATAEVGPLAAHGAVSCAPAPGGGAADARVARLGPHAAGVLHLAAPLGGAGARPALRALRRVPASALDPALIVGSPVVLHARGDDAGADAQRALLAALVAALADAGEALVCSGAVGADLAAAAPSPFCATFALVPAASPAGGEPALCALRVAALEELLPARRGAAAAPPSAELVREVRERLAAMAPLGRLLDPAATSVHATVELLVRESRPPPKPAVPAPVPAAAPRASAGKRAAAPAAPAKKRPARGGG